MLENTCIFSGVTAVLVKVSLLFARFLVAQSEKSVIYLCSLVFLRWKLFCHLISGRANVTATVWHWSSLFSFFADIKSCLLKIPRRMLVLFLLLYSLFESICCALFLISVAKKNSSKLRLIYEISNSAS